MLSKFDWASILIIIALFAASFYLYPGLPDEIPTHWNARGEIDDYSSKEMVFLFPVIIFLIYGLFLVLPKIAVFRENIKSFKHFESMKLALVLFFSLIFSATLLPNFGYDDLNMSRIIMPIIGLLLIYSGYIIKDAKRNFFIGIRTPWTLASDYAWEKTHKLGSKGFMLAGILMFLTLIFPPTYMVWFILVIVLGLVAILFVYSYLIWVKAGKKDL